MNNYTSNLNGFYRRSFLSKSQIQAMIDDSISNQSNVVIDVILQAISLSGDLNYTNISIPNNTQKYTIITENSNPDLDGDEMSSITDLIVSANNTNIIINPVEYVIKTTNSVMQYPNVPVVDVKNIAINNINNTLNFQIANLFYFEVRCRFFF
jgi:hypothetical protein